jgi:hypothetical protein
LFLLCCWVSAWSSVVASAPDVALSPFPLLASLLLLTFQLFMAPAAVASMMFLLMHLFLLYCS